MVVSHTLEIAIHVLKSANGGLFYTPLYQENLSFLGAIQISTQKTFFVAACPWKFQNIAYTIT